MFSIIIPSYNSSSYIDETIKSVINQTFSNWEVIIVDDFSSDDSLSIVESFASKDERIKVFKHLKNSGVAVARNTAIKEAKGRYIAFLDSDDQWLPNKLELQLEQFKKGAKIVFSSYIRFFEDGTEKVVKVPKSINYEELLLGNCIGNLTGAYNLEELGRFYQEEIGHEDYLMWLNVLKVAGCGVGIQEPLARYRVGSESLSSNKVKSAQWTWNIYRQHLDLGLIKSIYSFIFYMANSLKKRI